MIPLIITGDHKMPAFNTAHPPIAAHADPALTIINHRVQTMLRQSLTLRAIGLHAVADTFEHWACAVTSDVAPAIVTPRRTVGIWKGGVK